MKTSSGQIWIHTGITGCSWGLMDTKSRVAAISGLSWKLLESSNFHSINDIIKQQPALSSATPAHTRSIDTIVLFCYMFFIA